jgi:Tfp pilus assembly protein PilE
VSKRGSLGGLALIEVVIAIVLVGMLCAVAVAALAA